VSFAEYSQVLSEAYKQFKLDHPSTDKEAYALACKPILDYCEERKKPDKSEDKAIVPLMHSYKKQFTNLVCFLCYLLHPRLRLFVM
jgi:hypothetical protein